MAQYVSLIMEIYHHTTITLKKNLHALPNYSQVTPALIY